VWYKLFQRESDEIDIHMMSGYQEGPKVKKKVKLNPQKPTLKPYRMLYIFYYSMQYTGSTKAAQREKMKK